MLSQGVSATDSWDESRLFNAANDVLWQSDLKGRYCWRNNPKAPDYNPELGCLEYPIGKFVIKGSVGLQKDGFYQPCCVLYITHA